MKKSIIILFAASFYLIACGENADEHSHGSNKHNEHDGHDHDHDHHEQETFTVEGESTDSI